VAVRRLGTDQTRDFCRSISQLAVAEGSLLRALAILKDSATPVLRAALAHMQQELKAHGSASRACELLFPPQVTAIIRIYERLGFVIIGFEAVAIALDKGTSFRVELFRRLTYPLILLTMMAVMGPFSELLTGSLNAFLIALAINVSVLAGSVIVLFLGLPYALNHSALGTRLKRAAWALPWPATLYVHHIRVLLCRLASHNIGALMPLDDALRAAAEVTADPRVLKALESAFSNSETKIADHLGDIGFVAPPDLMLVVSASRSGALPGALDTLADRYLECYRKAFRWVSPLFLAVVVVFVTLSIVGTIKDVVNQAGNIPGFNEIRQIDRPSQMNKNQDLKAIEKEIERLLRSH
jgi:type II secretory pathway component PulF